ncbi:ribosomal L7Ae/L30e/S12e/Gadd45 family protein [Ruminococcus sp. FC2018]|uniref:L7Ae/L30e/S12e/Gadd45 family ribosomal protein n=1 Tax=Ruminococcus sp. FC2018 TaxID=1410617 RepID=UPI00048B91F2|nr:ribosomal L7Ae/L30e/S12e/Gadd45 family protein [Ruminococcus sp. FC2018]
MSSNKAGIITMSRKAGKLVTGMDMVKRACCDAAASAVFVTKDLSEKSFKEVRFTCAKYNVKLYRLDMTMDDMDLTMGKRTGVVAMTDRGFARSCAKDLEEIGTDKNQFES